MKSAFGLLLVAVLLVGCGTRTDKSINAKFTKLDYEMASIEEGKGETTVQHLEVLTQRYIRLVRQYEDELGGDEVKKRLEDKAFELGPYCLTCVTMLDSEAEKY